ncbi:MULTISPECIES: DUF177 domain-containing protein [Brucella/Ochrobactrum group]|uniref:YceD family protein n=1 Tax=Brucella/Ochrobactrum group TaxID=2826938 RepID=UPI001656069B|nr:MULTISPECIES: DUF177 domain-containing protein [Brucella/Ochrobactrum group]MBC8717683.1 DUF177 domain-containing protein [Ochrobactrum sp. Marseille-Q0166]
MTDKPALTYPVPVLHLPHKGLTVKIGTNEKERAALSVAHGLQSVKSFDAEFLLTPWKKRGIRVRGTIKAEVVQSCVATLEPLDAMIDEDIDTIFVPEDSRLAKVQLDESGELLLDAEGADIPETFVGDRIDLGAVAEEFFELALDPYPRKPGLPDEVEPIVFGDMEDGDKPDSPFAKLSDWSKKP